MTLGYDYLIEKYLCSMYFCINICAFTCLQGTTCSFSLVAHQILLRGQTLRPRNMPKGCGGRTPL